jgi:hypothetical protein
MEEVSSYETLVPIKVTRCHHIPKDGILHALRGSHTFQHNLGALRLSRVRILSKNPRSSANSWKSFSTCCCKICKSQITTEYAEICNCFHSKKSREWSSTGRGGHLTGLRFLSTNIRFRCSLTKRRKWGGFSWCMMHKYCWSRRKRWYPTPANLLGKAIGPKEFISYAAHTNIDEILLLFWRQGELGIVMHQNMGIMNVHNAVPCISHNISSKWDTVKCHPCTMIRRSVGLHALHMIWQYDCIRRLLQIKCTQISPAVQFFTHCLQDSLPWFSTRCPPYGKV